MYKKLLLLSFILFFSSIGAIAAPHQVFPVDGADNVPIDAHVSVHFAKTNIGADFLFRIVDESGTAIEGDILIENTGITFTPNEPFSYGSVYYANFVSFFIGTQRITWQFKTEANITLVDSSPQQREKQVPIDKALQFHFSQNILPNQLSIELVEQGTEQRVSGKTVITNKTLTFFPKDSLSYESSYVARLVDLGGAILENDFELSFATEKAALLGDFHPLLIESGETEFYLHPIDGVKTEELINISFGIPFPKGYLSDIANFRIIDASGEEVDIRTKELLSWGSSSTNDSSIRSVLVNLGASFDKDDNGNLVANKYLLQWGTPSERVDGEIDEVQGDWRAVDEINYNASFEIQEPKAYAVFTSDWYGRSVIKSRLFNKGSHPELTALDEAFELFGQSAINFVDPRVPSEGLYPYHEQYASWLYDRAMTLYQLAFKTGSFRYLRQAHLATQFYAKHLNEDGFFTLKPSNDLKYSYAESLLTNYMLTGDTQLLSKIENVAQTWELFDNEYTLNTRFWTERHVAFKLKANVVAFEATGKQEYKDRSKTIFESLRGMQNNPISDIAAGGSLAHTAASHGEVGEGFIASPWMSALLADAVERYYIHIDQEGVADFIVKLATFFQQQDISIYQWKGYSGNEDYKVPRYFVFIDSEETTKQGYGAEDTTHVPDVLKLFGLGYFFSCSQGNCDNSFLATIDQLNKTMQTYTFPNWIRVAAPSVGKTSYRNAPPRRFNWWFNASANLDFLIGTNTTFKDINQSSSLSIKQELSGPEKYEPGATYKLSYTINNNSELKATNVIVASKLLKYSVAGQIELLSFTRNGYNRAGELIWKISEIPGKTSIEDIEVEFKIKPYTVLPTISRPLDKLLSFAELKYCLEGDEDCISWGNNWDLGTQTRALDSEWTTVTQKAPDSPPELYFSNISDGDSLDGKVDVEVIVDDADGINKLELWLNGEKQEEVYEAPFIFSVQFDSLSTGLHTLEAKAIDILGSVGEATIQVTASNPDVEAPEISIFKPENGQTYCDSVSLDYIVNDLFEVVDCNIELDDHMRIIEGCSAINISKELPYISSALHVSFEDALNPYSNQGTSQQGGVANEVEIVNQSNKGQVGVFEFEASHLLFEDLELEISNDISVAFWMKPTESKGLIVSQGFGYVGNEQGWAISLGPNNHLDNNELSLTWTSGNNLNNANSGNVVQTDANSVELGKWQHVVVTKQDKVVNIYINGSLIESGTIAAPNIAWKATTKKNVLVAQSSGHPELYSEGFKGSLDDILIWNKALTPKNIASIFNGAIGQEVTLKIKAKDKAGNVGEQMSTFKFSDCS